MGILLEADYKGVISGKESISSGLRRAFSERKGGGRVSGSGNPLERREPGEGLEPDEGDGQITYELMNRDSGTYAYVLQSREDIVLSQKEIGA